MSKVTIFVFDNVKEGEKFEFDDVEKIITEDGILTVIIGDTSFNFNIRFVIGFNVTVVE